MKTFHIDLFINWFLSLDLIIRYRYRIASDGWPNILKTQPTSLRWRNEEKREEKVKKDRQDISHDSGHVVCPYHIVIDIIELLLLCLPEKRDDLELESEMRWGTRKTNIIRKKTHTVEESWKIKKYFFVHNERSSVSICVFAGII